ncbi:hypothetical protein V6N13_103267 [Hibiscus sabdariffa]
MVLSDEVCHGGGCSGATEDLCWEPLCFTEGGHDLAMAWDASRRAPPRRASLTYNRWLVEEGVAGHHFSGTINANLVPLPNCGI